MCRCMTHHPNHQDNKDEYNSGFIFPLLILGFVIVPLLVWPTVVALGRAYIHADVFWREMLFSISAPGQCVFHFSNYNFELIG